MRVVGDESFVRLGRGELDGSTSPKVQHRFFHMEPKLWGGEELLRKLGVDFPPRLGVLVRWEWMVMKVEIVDAEVRNRIEQERSAQLQS